MLTHKAAKAMMILAIVSRNLAEQYPPGPKRKELDDAADDAQQLAEEIQQYADAQSAAAEQRKTAPTSEAPANDPQPKEQAPNPDRTGPATT